MQQIIDRRFEYGLYHGCRGHCRLQVWRAAGEPDVAMVTELEDNLGVSITDAAAHLATEVYELLECPPEGLVWIEHYPRDVHGTISREHWVLVLFSWNGRAFDRPQWISLRHDSVDQLIGRTLVGEQRSYRANLV